MKKMIVVLLVHNPSPLILKKTRLHMKKVKWSLNDGMKQIMDEIAKHETGNRQFC